jgi:hypothetical protein
MLFTGVRGIGILRSPDAGNWIKPRNTSALRPWAGAIYARGGRYYLRLDAYAGFWMPYQAVTSPDPRFLAAPYVSLPPAPPRRP